MRFLLTNDDGIEADGLRALAAALDGLGEVVVIASWRPYSCMGHGITQDGDIRVEKADVPGLGRCFIVDGTPADCVRIGLGTGVTPKPDVILAGINHGGNLGVDIFYSGTLAAVREAAILGIPAIACSQYRKKDRDTDWAAASRMVRRTLPWLLKQPTQPGLHWNVNLPFLANGAPEPAIRVTRVGVAPPPVQFTANGDGSSAHRTFRNTARYETRPIEPDTDVEHVFAGGIAVTPLHLDLTAPEAHKLNFGN